MLATVASCTVAPVETQPVEEMAEPAPFEVDASRLTEVRLEAVLPTTATVRVREHAGLVLALLESGLAEIRHLVPRVEGASLSPGLAGWGQGEAQVWRARVSTEEPTSGELTASIQLCSPTDECTEHAVSAAIVELPQALGPLYATLAQRLGQPPLPGATETWAQPLSSDPYALLVSGRAAASFYGLLPAVGPDIIGDRRRDPVARAVFLDPELPIAEWIAGRRALVRGETVDARQAFTRAALAGERRVLFGADEAAALLSLGGKDAARAWDAVRRLAPDDIRFVPGHARALFESGALGAALTQLDALPARYQHDLAVLPLRALIAEKGFGRDDYEGLLVAWERASPSDAEPVRRHIRLLVAQQRLGDALAQAQRLAEVGAPRESAQLAMALAVGTRDWGLALRKAEEAGLSRAAGDIRARAALDVHPSDIPPELDHTQEVLPLLARTAAHIAGGRFGKALFDANRVLELRAWMPEALALKARAQWGLGRAREAERTEATLRFVDPAWPADTDLPPYGAPRPLKRTLQAASAE